MKRLLIGLLLVVFAAAPLAASVSTARAMTDPTQSPQQAPPPVAQPLVREGDFALRLVEVLKIGKADNEAEAESRLAALGIAPSNGWIADYPVTPDILAEVRSGIQTAADSGKLPLNSYHALKAADDLSAEFGLAMRPAAPRAVQTVQADPPTATLYSDPATVNNYYYQYGPPVVTYYPPPWDYSYLYLWVPFSFFYVNYWFPGYYCLRDFDHVVVTGPYHYGHYGHYGHYRYVSNHCVSPYTHRTVLVDPAHRWVPADGGSRQSSREAYTRPQGGFRSPGDRTRAASIVNRSSTRTGTGGDRAAPGGGVPGRTRVGQPGGDQPSRPSSPSVGPERTRAAVGSPGKAVRQASPSIAPVYRTRATPQTGTSYRQEARGPQAGYSSRPTGGSAFSNGRPGVSRSPSGFDRGARVGSSGGVRYSPPVVSAPVERPYAPAGGRSSYAESSGRGSSQQFSGRTFSGASPGAGSLSGSGGRSFSAGSGGGRSSSGGSSGFSGGSGGGRGR